MCILAGPAHISSTRIAALISKDGTKQFTVYEMEFEAPRPFSREHILLDMDRPPGNAMILPVPWEPGDPSIRMIDLSNSEDFFGKLESLVDKPRHRSFSKGLSYEEEDHLSLLEVLEVGNFNVSIGYSLADINRANPDVFKLSQGASEILSANYASGFAFVICALRASGKIHPLGYISTLSGSRLFIPTRHEHGDSKDLPDWDHSIYVSCDERAGKRSAEAASLDVSNGQMSFLAGMSVGSEGRFVNRVWDDLVRDIPEMIEFRAAHPVAKYTLKGKFANTDFRPSVGRLIQK